MTKSRRATGARRHRTWLPLLSFLVALVAREPSAAADWLDEMPTVDRVVEVVDEQYHRSPNDQSTVAINLAATLILLRQLMEYRVAEEPGMSAERRSQIATIRQNYLLAEYALGRAPGSRRGALSPAAVQQFYESRRYEKCVPADCYGYWVRFQLEFWNAASFRERLLPLLFPCGSAPELLALATRNALNAPLIPSTPAAPEARDSAALGRLAQATRPPAACPASGGDVDGDGLCFDWETTVRSARSQAPAAAVCGTLTLTKATTPDARGIEIEYVVDERWRTADVEFKVYRSGRRELDGSEPIVTRTLAVGPSRSTPAPLRVADDADLAPDTNKPYVIVVAKYADRESSAWFQKHLVGVLVHGYTFRKAYEMVNAIGRDGGFVMADWLLANDEVEPWQDELENSLEAACYDPATFAFNWRHASIDDLGSLLTSEARRLFARVASTAAAVVQQHAGDVVDLHFIGHSRGAVMTSQALVEWSVRGRDAVGLKGSSVIVTLLDPHPADNAAPLQEDYERDNSLARFVYDGYKEFQASTKDPAIVLPAGVGIREIQVLYQQNTAAAISANPPTRDNLVDRNIDLFTGFYLWGQDGEYVRRNNRSGVPIRARRLTQFEDGETVTHSGVVSYYQERFPPRDPLLVVSPERGNCQPIFRF